MNFREWEKEIFSSTFKAFYEAISLSTREVFGVENSFSGKVKRIMPSTYKMKKTGKDYVLISDYVYKIIHESQRPYFFVGEVSTTKLFNFLKLFLQEFSERFSTFNEVFSVVSSEATMPMTIEKTEQTSYLIGSVEIFPNKFKKEISFYFFFSLFKKEEKAENYYFMETILYSTTASNKKYIAVYTDMGNKVDFEKISASLYGNLIEIL